MKALDTMRAAFEAHYFAGGNEEIERKGDGYALVGAQIAWDAWQQAYNAGVNAMAECDQIVFENAATRMQLLDDALTAYVLFAATRRTELGSLSPEMEVVDAQAVAALAGTEPQAPGIVAWFRQEQHGQRLARWVECTPFQPGAVRFAAKAFPSLRSLAKPTGSTQ